MKALQPRTLGVSPLYLLDGLRPPLQAVLVWLWHAELTGEVWTMKGLGEHAGMGAGTLKKCLDELTRLGIVYATDSKKAPFGCNADFVPTRAAAVVEKKRAEAFEDWVFKAMKAWKEGRGGVVGPREVHNSLHLAVTVQGEDKVLNAFQRYARDGDKRFDTLKRFPENMGQWTAGHGAIATPRQMGEE